MKRKLFAIVLAVLMVVSILPVSVFANGGVAEYNSVEYDTLQEAIDAAEAANDANIVIDLYADAVLDIGAWQAYEIGGSNAATITINGNGHTLTFNKRNSDWNHVATSNNNAAKLILNDMTLADMGYNNGPWNRYDHNFACDVELNNVVSNKALAFKANAVLNDVTINDSNDVYAIWIQANGQTVEIDGLTVNAGRGIKIDEQYVTPEKVTLIIKNAAFDTNKKAAIIVKSVEGADITVDNVDISNVAADNINAVWVDEDSADYEDEVVVHGSSVVVEGQEETTFVFNANGGKLNGVSHKVVKYGEPIGALPTATKRGHDFIGWAANGVLINENTIASGNIVLVAVFEANELGNTEILPRLYPLTVIAGEGGTVEGFSGSKNLMIAFGAGRKIDIVPDEYHVVKNVVVNGKYNLGAVESYEIVSAHMAYTVEVEFEDKMVTEKTAVYTEDFSAETKWVSGGTAEAAVLADGKLTVKSTGGDPNINMPEAFGLDCAKIDEIVVKYTNNTENTSFQIFFTNEANPGYSEAGSFKADCVAGENTVVIKTEGNALWTGTLANMRIDLSNGEGEFVVDEITFQTVETMTAKEAAALVKAAE